MRLSLCTLLVASIPLLQGSAPDPERLLADRFGFTPADIGQVRAGQPVARMLASGQREELGIVGAVRLSGDKARLADWVRNVQHFRGSAQLGVARVIPSPATEAAFADLVLDAADLAELQRCRPGKCDIRLSDTAMTAFQRDVPWGTGDAPGRATAIARTMLAGFADAYAKGGLAGLDTYAAKQGSPSATTSLRGLFQRATTVGELSPDLIGYLERFPAAAPAGTDQCLYWSSMPVESGSIVSLHHLAVSRPRADQVIIADQTLYASRYFDVGAVVIALLDAPGGGYYAIAGSRAISPQLSRPAAVVLRRQVERSAADTLRTYLEWLRDSLSL